MKKSIYLLLTLCFVLFASTLRAQSWQWAIKGGGISTDNAKDMYVDGNGNSYITGTFSGTATFGSLASLTSSGSTDIFVAKFDPSGVALWAKKAGGTDANGETATGIWLSPSGECRITGGFYGIATFGATSVTSAGYSDIYVASYNASTGAEISVVRFGTASVESGTKITVDASNNSYIGGVISGSITFPGLTAITGTNFALKLGSTGTPIWARAGNVSSGGSARTTEYV